MVSACWLNVGIARAETVYVDPAKGADTGPGNAEQPWKTLKYADSQARPGITVLLVGGTYVEEFRPTASGTEKEPIIYKAADPKNPPIFEGGAQITHWKKFDEKKNIWVADLPSDNDPHAIFQDEKKMLPAQWPSQTDGDNPYDLTKMLAHKEVGPNPTADIVDPDHLRLPAGTFDGGVLVHYNRAANGIVFKKITAHDPDKGILTTAPIDGEFGSDKPIGDPKTPGGKDLYAVRNCMIALDDPGEWLVNTQAKPFKVYLIPFGNKDPNDLTIVATDKTHAITSQGKDLSNVIFDGLTFRHFHDATHMNRPAQSIIAISGATFSGGGKAQGKVSNVTVRNCAMYHNYSRSVTSFSGDNFLLENNDMWGNEMTVNTGVLHIVRGKNCRMVNNHIHDNVGDGIWSGTGGNATPYAVDGLEIRGNDIHDNTSRKSHTDQVQMAFSDNVTFIENRIHNRETNASLLWAEGSGKVTFIRNSFENSYLGVNSPHETYFYNNVFREMLVRLNSGGRPTSKIEFRNNVVFNSGVWIPSDITLKALKSIESDHNFYYIDEEAKKGPFGSARASDWIFLESYTRLRDKFPEDKRGDRVWLVKASQDKAKWGFAFDNTSIDGFAKKLAPADIFADSAKGDFHLKAGSPLIDAGVDVGQPFHGKAPDIGMFESEEKK